MKSVRRMAAALLLVAFVTATLGAAETAPVAPAQSGSMETSALVPIFLGVGAATLGTGIGFWIYSITLPSGDATKTDNLLYGLSFFLGGAVFTSIGLAVGGGTLHPSVVDPKSLGANSPFGGIQLVPYFEGLSVGVQIR